MDGGLDTRMGCCGRQKIRPNQNPSYKNAIGMLSPIRMLQGVLDDNYDEEYERTEFDFIEIGQ